MGSAYELDYQLLLSRDLNYVDASKYKEINAKLDSVKRQIAALLKKVRAGVDHKS